MKKILSIFVCILCILPLSAQTVDSAQTYTFDQISPDTVTGLRHYKRADNWFISLQGGGNLSMSENVRPRDIKDALGWSAALSIGKYFSPQVGARIQAAFLFQHGLANKEAKAAYPQYYGDGIYDFKNVNADSDALFNLNNIFSQFKESRRFDVVGVFGIGINSVFDLEKDKLNRWATAPAPYRVYTKNGTYLAMRAGFQFNYQIANAWDLGLELTMNATNDKYNGIIYDDKYDGYVNAMLGLTYHLKDHFGDRRFKYRRLTDYDEWESLNNRINDARAALDGIKPVTSTVAIQERFLDMTINFFIDKYDITDIQKKNVEAVANFLKTRDDINLIVTGYADVQTAYPEYNLRLSQRRAQAVYDMLVNEFGVDPSRLSMDYKGDTIQPYMLKNEWNRVVVFQIVPRN